MSAIVMAGARLIGDVQLGDGASVWYNAVLRADLGTIRIGAGSNIQDNCTLHVDAGQTLSVGENATVGHGCILHGCTLADNVFVGMGSVVMNGAVLGADCMLGAGSLVTEGTVIPGGMLALGRPAKVKRPLTEEEIAANRKAGSHYAHLAQSPVQQAREE